MKQMLRSVFSGTAIGLAVGVGMSALLLWLGLQVFPRMQIVHLLLMVGVASLVVSLAARRFIDNKKNAASKP